MTKEDLIAWLNVNPGLQRRIERDANLSAGYLSKLKNKETEPYRSTLKAIEEVIKEILEERHKLDVRFSEKTNKGKSK